MDVHMPVMDGLTATREIRKLESEQYRVPILALTASVMTDERSRCLAAGMDGMLTKPIELQKLREAVVRFARSVPPPSPSAETPPVVLQETAPSDAPIDLERLLKRVGNDQQFVSRLCRSFVVSAAETVDELDRAAANTDRSSLVSLGHKLKGSSRTVFATRIGDLAENLERDAVHQPEADIEMTLSDIRSAVNECSRYVIQNLA
jgi:DNA-binding response OmpR family regulator